MRIALDSSTHSHLVRGYNPVAEPLRSVKEVPLSDGNGPMVTGYRLPITLH